MGQILPEYLSKWTTEKVRKGNMFDDVGKLANV